ncbi:MAG: sulfite exporter TauE/SafE family protein [Burkholderiaceae bacterium]
MGIASVLAVVLAGWLIGATGIGGVLVVPALTRLGDVAVSQAIAASALGFAFPGVAALWMLRREPGKAEGCGPLIGGALPGALVGAALVHLLEPRVLLVLVAALVIFAGLRGLSRERAAASPKPPPHPAAMAGLGALVGLGSALTGTGGPVLLIPLLMLWRRPLVHIVAAAQAVQLPVAATSTAVHWFSGALDVRLGCLIGLVLLAGSVAGQRAARRMDVHRLHRLLAGLLLTVGAWFAWLAGH